MEVDNKKGKGAGFGKFDDSFLWLAKRNDWGISSGEKEFLQTNENVCRGVGGVLPRATGGCL